MDHHEHQEILESPWEYTKFAGIIGTTAIAAWLLPLPFMQSFMGLFFLVLAAFKLIGYQHFTMAYRRYDWLSRWIPGYVQLYPFLELTLGLVVNGS